MGLVVRRQFILSDVAVLSIVCDDFIAGLHLKSGKLTCVVGWIKLVSCTQRNAFILAVRSRFESYIRYSELDRSRICRGDPCSLG